MRPFSLPVIPDSTSIFNNLADKVIPIDANDVEADLSCERLEALYPHLDLIARKSYSHIDPLHVHLRKGRTIRITEDGHLHLLWDADTVYIKPIPTCLLSPEFWTAFLPVGSTCRPHAIGFMRTYAYLIRHRSDFTIAQREDLIPPTTENIQHSQFEAFIKEFKAFSNDEVSPRWHFGQLRLTWLNWAVRIFQPKAAASRGGMFYRLFYTEQHYQTGQFLREFGGPILFIFASLSLVLSAMQVVLAAQADHPWKAFMSCFST
ncbi:hypothetical protein FHETE_2085 [Fusarium heterosporum]|uniref:Uncharacterized protein n=1 Tax=Fusarium heterosporum TaxID=42747 RepID=A0A8H5TWV0_FUSHE|nr:hypothetical protein FHETE_2085 [Fusarium heterosporum]